MTFSKIRSIWEISLQNMVMVTSYFIKQSVPSVFTNSRYAWCVITGGQKPSLTQQRGKESSQLQSAAVQNPNHAGKQNVILANTVAWNTSFMDGSSKP